MNARVLHEQYLAVLKELKERLDLLSGMVTGKIELPDFAEYEFGYLQLRMICELIALGCLIVHRDGPNIRTRKILDSYEPRKIMRHLETLHPVYFLVPAAGAPGQNGTYDVDVDAKDVLTKRELLQLYGKCGDVLHKGSVTNFLKGQPRDPKELVHWHNRILVTCPGYFGPRII